MRHGRTSFRLLTAVALVLLGWHLGSIVTADPGFSHAEPQPSPETTPWTVATTPAVTASTKTTPVPAPTPAVPPTPVQTPPARMDDKTTLLSLLSEVEVVPARPNAPGYDRSCSPGAGCVFGTEWNDATDAPMGHNGCDTRNDVLGRDLVDVVTKNGTNDCVVLRGVLNDPYTGRSMAFERGWNTSIRVQIDHLIPLAAAWDLGAADWPESRREAFSNDVEHELLAVDGNTNMAKGDQTPADWLPPNPAFQCEYGIRYLRASLHWRLPVSRDDADAIRRVAESRCG